MLVNLAKKAHHYTIKGWRSFRFGRGGEEAEY